jgi:DNA-binding GntR family transcriptional regulator
VRNALDALQTRAPTGRRALDADADAQAPTPATGQLPKTLLADAAYRQIKAAILSCRLAPGTMLGSAQLGASLGMSRTPVQEALKALTLEGLLIAAPRAGYRVTPVTVRDIEEIFDLRRTLEVHGVGLAAKSAATRDVQILRAQHRHAEEHCAKGALGDPEYLQTVILNNRDFHVSIAAMSGNARLAKTVGALLDEGQRFYYLYFQAPKPRWDPHALIIDALAARDPQAARQAMAAHIDDQAAGVLAEATGALG